jgi:hypothetical protein
MSDRVRHRLSRSQPARPRIARRAILFGGIAAGTAVVAGVWLARDSGTAAHAYTLAPESVLPPDIQQAPTDVREAYRFAVANRETLRYIPCFWGCGADGHTSNASCYVTNASTPERIEFDRMSLG